MNSNNSLVQDVLETLSDVFNMLPRPLETPYQHVRRLRKITYKGYYDTVYQMKKRGLVQVERKQGKNIIALTKQGILEALLAKAGVKKVKNWDGKWRVCIFDIPEDAHLQRDRLRWLLKRYGFYKLQGSVFVNPYPLNRQAMDYLRESGLSEFIRFMKVEEMDNDADLKKVFGLM